jgi:hypothetical protein
MAEDKDQGRELAELIDAVEEAYEFMLAYAAQGCQGDEEGGKRESIRAYLEKADAALDRLGAATAAAFQARGTIASSVSRAFLDVFEQDARNAQAVIRLALARPSISSQLIDNLNSSIHVRTLLTDLFLLDETLTLSAGPH